MKVLKSKVVFWGSAKQNFFLGFLNEWMKSCEFWRKVCLWSEFYKLFNFWNTDGVKCEFTVFSFIFFFLLGLPVEVLRIFSFNLDIHFENNMSVLGSNCTMCCKTMFNYSHLLLYSSRLVHYCLLFSHLFSDSFW